MAFKGDTQHGTRSTHPAALGTAEAEAQHRLHSGRVAVERLLPALDVLRKICSSGRARGTSLLAHTARCAPARNATHDIGPAAVPGTTLTMLSLRIGASAQAATGGGDDAGMVLGTRCARPMHVCKNQRTFRRHRSAEGTGEEM